MKRHFCYLLAFFILQSTAVFLFSENARAERPSFRVYTTGEGLAHDTVNKIVRDSRGFLWFCTAEGLSRFDGTRFKNFTTDHGLPHRSVMDLLETRDGDYLIATSAGLAVFNPNGKPYRWNILENNLEQTGSEPAMFQTFVPQNNENRQKSTILSLGQDRLGRIWAGTANGLFRVEKSGANWTFREIVIEEWKEKGFGFLTFLKTSKGDFLVAASAAVFSLSDDGSLKKIAETGANSMLEDRDGKIWLDTGATGQGLKVFSFENGSLTLLKTYTKKDGLPDDSYYFALHETWDGRIFVGMHDGLAEFVPDAKANEPQFRILGKDKVETMAEDAGGNLWLGTELKGAWKMARNNLTIFGEEDGFAPEDDIRSIYITPENEIFVPARPRKILYFRNGKFESIVPFGLEKRSWSWHFLDFISKDGEWWIPTEKGLYRYPKIHGSELGKTPPKKIYTTADGLSGNEIFNIFEDSRGDIWFTIVGAENSLMRWERNTEKLFNYTTADGLPRSNGPISFAEDSDGGVWFGFYFGGLARFKDGKFAFYSEKDGFPTSLVGDLFYDSAGRLWIGTSGRGLFRVDKAGAEKPIFKSISIANGLSSNQIHCLIEDRFNQMYVGTGRGINRIDGNGNIRVFTQADGLPSNSITRCAADKNGFLWFVTQNTLVRFLPEIENNIAPPPVFIDKISAGGVPQKISALGETEINLPDLFSDQKQIQIDFFALTFGAGENIRYQYRLNDQDWSTPTDQQTLNLDLASGEQEFAVRDVRSDGAASEKPAVVSFKILPPVWARWWFIVLSTLFVCGVILLIYYYRTANLRKINAALTEANRAAEDLRRAREERLAELEKVRSRIATDLHDDIGASLTQIAILSEVARQQSKTGNGAIAEPLQMISSVSNELVETMSDVVWSINPGKDHLSDLTQRMRRFASDVLSARDINLIFHSPDAEKEITLNTNVRREVFLIFKESINNIVKHSAASEARVEMGISDSGLALEIADDGKGFNSKEKIDLKSEISNVRTHGNGILNMKKRAREMNGELNVISSGSGTIIKLRLPLE